MKQPAFEGFEKPKRSPARVMAHMVDAGGHSERMVFYVCGKCGWESGWIVDERCASSVLNGVPCQACNDISGGRA